MNEVTFQTVPISGEPYSIRMDPEGFAVVMENNSGKTICTAENFAAVMAERCRVLQQLAINSAITDWKYRYGGKKR